MPNITGSLLDAVGAPLTSGTVTLTPYGADAKVDGTDVRLGSRVINVADLPDPLAVTAGDWTIVVSTTATMTAGARRGAPVFDTRRINATIDADTTWGALFEGAFSVPEMTPSLVLEAQTAKDEAEAAQAAAETAAANAAAAVSTPPAYATGHSGKFDATTSVYNLTPSSVHSLRSKVAAAINSRVKVAAIGHSMLAGSNASPGTTDMPRQLRDLLSSAGVSIGGTGIVYTSSKETLDSRWTLSAGWTRSTGADSAYSTALASTETATFTSTIAGTAVDISYLSTGRAFTYTIDGGAPTTVTPSGADATTVVSATGLANTAHTVVVKPLLTGTNASLYRGTASFTSGAAKFGSAGRASGVYAVTDGLGFAYNGNLVALGTATIECWFRLSAPPSGTKVIVGRGGMTWIGVTSSGFITTQSGAGAPGTNVTLTGTTNYCDGAWHHLALVLDAGKPSVYVDGTRILTSATAAVPSGAINGALYIGSLSDTGSSFDWTGDIDGVRISNNTRYTGASFTTPTAAPSADANTVNLYNFNGDANDVPVYLVGAGVRGTTGLEITNAGRGGTRATEWIAAGGTKLFAEVMATSPSLAVVQLDTNEGVGGISVATYKANMTTLLNALDAAGVPFMLVASPSLNPGGGGYPAISQATWEALVEAEYDLADTYDVPLLDTTHMFVDHATAAADGLMGDEVHPGPVGYRRIAQGIAKVLTG